MNASIDTTGLESHHVSQHYLKRKGRTAQYRRWHKLILLCDNDSHLIPGVEVGYGPSYDGTFLPDTVKSAVDIIPIQLLLADSGFDDEKNHILCREQLQIKSVIALNRRGSQRGVVTGKYRKQLDRRFPEELYHQRAQAENVISCLKRRLESYLRARTESARQVECLMRVLTFNLMILLCTFLKSVLFTSKININDMLSTELSQISNFKLLCRKPLQLAHTVIPNECEESIFKEFSCLNRFFASLRMTFLVTVPALLLVTILYGCSKKSVPADPVNLENTPLRIVSMAPNLTEILFALGLDEEIVGVTRHCTYPERAKTKSCIGTFWQPDIEAMLACKPTLVIALGFEQQTLTANRLKKIGCQTLIVEGTDIESMARLYEAIRTIGDAVHRPQQATELISRIKAKQAELSACYASLEKPKVLWVVQREPLRVAGTKTYINELIETVGGVNAIGETLNVYPPISAEEFIGCMPDVIIEPSMAPEQIQSQKATVQDFYQRFAVTPAVRNKRIYIIEGDLVSRLGPRVEQGMELVADCLWPQHAK